MPATTPPDLEDQARIFAAEVTELLNGTVAHGVRLAAIIAHQAATTVHVGRGITRRNLRAQPIPLTLGQKPASCHLFVGYVLESDPEGLHLAVSKSQYGIYLDEGRSQMLVHWDYERDPVNDYPSAHIQVNGDSEHFATLAENARSKLGRPCPERPLNALHFPVGGRRFRPTLEDVIEFLIVEELVDSRSNARGVIDRHRATWEELQLKAAVRRSPEIALEQLREDGMIAP